MKRLFLVLMLVLVIPAHAQTVRQQFDKSVRLYKQGKYADSGNLLKSLVDKFHRTDGVILYNLAADEFRMHKPGMALFHLLMAAQSTNPRISSMARVGASRLRRFLTRSQARQKSAMRRFLFQPFHDYMTTSFGWVRFGTAIWLGLTAWFLGMIFLGVFRLGRARAYSGKVAAGLLLLAFISAGMAVGKYYVSHNYTMGILVRDAGMFKSADSLDPQSTLPQGLEVRVMQPEGAMMQVIVADGAEGFVQMDKIRVLPNPAHERD